MPEFRGYNFDQVLNAVTDLGMDNTGGTPISGTLHNNVSGGDLVVFPDGDYLCEDDGTVWGSQGGQAIGVVAKAAWDAYNGGDTRDPYVDDAVTYDDIYTANVDFMPKQNGGKIQTPHVAKTANMDLIIEGITLDHSNTSDANNDSGTLGISTGLIYATSMDIRNIDHVGRAINYSNPGNEEIAISAGTENGAGSVLVHSCELLKSHDESLYGNAGGRIGFYTGVSHEGFIEYNNCSASEIGNNGWYCSGAADDDPPEGGVHITDCYVENCGASGFRIAGGESKISNSEAVYDSTLYDGPHYTPADGGSRPIVLETSNAGLTASNQQTPGVTVENTTVKMRPCHKPAPAIHAYQTARTVNIIGCEIDIDGVEMSIYSPHPGDAQVGWILRSVYNQQFGSDGPGRDPRQLNLDNTTVVVKNIPSGSASTCIVAACDADDDHTTTSTGTHIHNGTCIEGSGNANAHDGVAVEFYDPDYSAFDATIENVNINVGGSTVNNIGGNNVTTTNVDTTSTCTLGDDPGGGAGTSFTEDFSRFLNGDNLFDSWTTTWGSLSSEWSVQEDVEFYSAARLTLDAASRTRRALIWDEVGTPSDVEIAIIGKTPDSWGAPTGGSHLRPIVRGGTSGAGDETGYFVATNDSQWSLISYNSDGSTTSLGTWGNPELTTKYRIRLRANASTISAKTWVDGTDEPGTWDISVTDTEHTSGWAGVGSFEQHDEFGYTSAATGGGTAPLPSISQGTPIDSITGLTRSVSGIFATVSERITFTMIDSFEDGDIAEYSGDTADFSVVSNPSGYSPQEGDNVLVHDTATNVSKLYSTSGLDNYFGKGEVAECYIRVSGSSSTSRPGFLFGFTDLNNYYECQLDYGTTTLQYRKNDGGTYGFANSTSLTSLSPGNWIKIKITWDDGTLGGADNDITLEAIDPSDGTSLGSFTVNDSTHATATGIAWSMREKDNDTAYDFANKPIL